MHFISGKTGDEVVFAITEEDLQPCFVAYNELTCVYFFMEKGLSPEEACKVIEEELGIERSCIRPCFNENGSRVSCLVGLIILIVSRNAESISSPLLYFSVVRIFRF